MFRPAVFAAASVGFACSLTAWYLLLTLTNSVRPGWEVFDLTSFRLGAFFVFVTILLGTGASILQSKRRWSQAVLGLAGLAVILSGAYCYLVRFDRTLSLAEGESFEPIPPVFGSINKGPLASIPPLAFTLTRVEPDDRKGVVHLVRKGVVSEVGTAWTKLGGAEISFSRAGSAPLVVVTAENGGELERSYVKLDLEPPGKEDSFMFETLPYEFFVRKEAPDSLHLNVRRGKISLFDGVTAIGGTVSLQGSRISFPDQRKFAIMRLRRQPGVFLFVATLVILALCGLWAAAAMCLPGRERRCRSHESSCQLKEVK